MKTTLKKATIIFLMLLMMLSMVACSPSSENNDYPQKEIRMIVCYNAGGQSDIIARKLVDIIQRNKFLDQPIIVTNIGGAQTVDALSTLTSAKPDGYTLMFHHNALITLKAIGAIETTIDDVDFVAQVCEQPFLIVARSDFPYDSIKDTVDKAKGNPQSIKVGHAGFGSPGHFAFLNFLYETDTIEDFKQILYTGGAEAIKGQLGGQVELRASNTGDSFRYIQSGDLKPIVFLSQARDTHYPDIPTEADLGIKNSITLRSGVFAPKGIPDSVKEKVKNAVQQACETKEFQDFIYNQGGSVVYADGEEFKNKFVTDKQIVENLTSVFGDKFQ